MPDSRRQGLFWGECVLVKASWNCALFTVSKNTRNLAIHITSQPALQSQNFSFLHSCTPDSGLLLGESRCGQRDVLLLSLTDASAATRRKALCELRKRREQREEIRGNLSPGVYCAGETDTLLVLYNSFVSSASRIPFFPLQVDLFDSLSDCELLLLRMLDFELSVPSPHKVRKTTLPSLLLFGSHKSRDMADCLLCSFSFR